ncbi:MAG TPA: CPXCG motif-containing cysteine-rich protein [Chromatiaceae bacterium]|jgi:hypothetical protein|nr:MAG: CPXCG motif-containing cysteine-rich protein [Thiohalocapsa sp. PB-PSB1]HBG96938.1 CPXCG motif-containing cysteine-rich protein [Chromatiaceae bacterium]HCS91318.1 CPXCG motif-containing cysteine-rich protein [Chromatiaceae bacterium]
MITPALYEIDRECPWCGEVIELTIDCSVGDQNYVEDCQVCCAPMVVSVFFDAEITTRPTVYLCREGE